MRIRNMIQHTIHQPFRSIALPIIAPLASRIVRIRRSTIRQSTTQRLIAIRIRALRIVRIVMRVRNVQHLERGHILVGHR